MLWLEHIFDRKRCREKKDINENDERITTTIVRWSQSTTTTEKTDKDNFTWSQETEENNND